MDDKFFLIPVDTLQGPAAPYSLFYSPFAHGCCLLTADEARTVAQAMAENRLTSAAFPDYAPLLDIRPDLADRARVPSPEHYTKMSLLPTYNCNFKCSYCYSAGGRARTVISKEDIDAALQFFLRPSGNKAVRSLFISGGGEPLIAWEQVSHAVLKAEELAAANGFRLEIIIITNGSLLKGDIIRFCLQHGINICVSFEITPEAQAMSRGHRDLVAANIRQCLAAGLTPSINTTITAQNVHCIPDMMRCMQEEFPGIHHLTLEPVTPNTGFASVEEMRAFYTAFMDSFSAARKQAATWGLDVNTTILDNMRRVAHRHCQGKLCVTPSATYTICHCASSPNEARYAKCSYGEIKDGRPVFSMEKFKSLQGIDAHQRPQCRSCYARWNCAGGCMSKLDAYPAEQMEEFCRYYREHLKRLLLEQLDDACRASSGKTLKELLQ